MMLATIAGCKFLMILFLRKKMGRSYTFFIIISNAMTLQKVILYGKYKIISILI